MTQAARQALIDAAKKAIVSAHQAVEAAAAAVYALEVSEAPADRTLRCPTCGTDDPRKLQNVSTYSGPTRYVCHQCQSSFERPDEE